MQLATKNAQQLKKKKKIIQIQKNYSGTYDNFSNTKHNIFANLLVFFHKTASILLQV